MRREIQLALGEGGAPQSKYSTWKCLLKSLNRDRPLPSGVDGHGDHLVAEASWF